MTNQDSNLAYIVVGDFGAAGVAYHETDVRYTDKETLLRDLMDAVYDAPVRVVAFDPTACDVSKMIAKEVVDLSWTEGIELPDGVIDFCEDHGVDVPEITQN